MKFELKTENEYFSKPFFLLFITFLTTLLIIIISSISIKLGSISKHYEINYFCKILTLKKTSTNFKKLSKILNISSRQEIWDFCRDFVK